MKKLFFFAASLLLIVSLKAQGLDFTSHEVSKMHCARASYAKFLDKRDGLTIMATNKEATSVTFAGTSGVLLLGINDEGKTVKTLKVSKRKESILVSASIVGDTVYLLAYGMEKGNYCDLYLCKVDITQWKLAGDPKLVRKHKNERNDQVEWHEAVSPDGHIRSLAVKEYSYRQRGTKDDQENVLLVFDNKFNLLWSREGLPGWYSSHTIDNDETVHAMLVGGSESRTYFLFANHTSYDEDVYMDSIDRGDIEACRMLNYVNGHFVAGGIIGAKQRALRDEQYTHLFALDYNTRTGKLAFNLQTFSHDELCVLRNISTDSRSRDTAMAGLVVKNGASTDFGGVLQIWTMILNIRVTNGSATHIYEYDGSLLAGIDTNANFVWRRPMRNSILSMSCPILIEQPVIYRNGRTYVLQTESSNAPAVYDYSRSIAPIAPLGAMKTSLAVYAIEDNGTVKKQTYPLHKMHCLLGGLQHIGDDWFVGVGYAKCSDIIHIKGL